MKLRQRLALQTVVGMGLLVHGIYLGTERWRAWQADRMLARDIQAAIAGDGRVRCEAQPATFGGGALMSMPPLVMTEPDLKPEPQIFAYAADFRSANPAAPPFPEDLKNALVAGNGRASGNFAAPGALGRQIASRMPWTEGPCAILLGRYGGFAIPFSTQMFRLSLVLSAILGAALLAAGPIIARIRRLAAAVKVSADSMYEIKVPETRMDEIGELERAFNQAGELVRTYIATIEEREAALRSAVSNTTHDVAVPLTVVQGHLSRLQAQLPADSRAHDGLRDAIRETHYLGALLHNLGAAARLERSAATIERHPVNLNTLVERVIARHSPLAATLGVELGAAVPEEPLKASADVTLFEQAASNLVHNAIHYNRPGGHVAVVLETIDHARRFSLRVLDDGPGIPASERAQLTQRTFRGAEGRARRPEGQGLGLAIVREVAELHGYDLQVGESEYGGAEIEIEGPADP